VVYAAINHIGDWQNFSLEKLPKLSKNIDSVWYTARLEGVNPEKNCLFFVTIDQEVEVWLNDRLIYEYGGINDSDTDVSGRHWHLIVLPDFTNYATLTLHLASERPTSLGKIEGLSIDSDLQQTKKLIMMDMIYVVALPVAFMSALILLLFCFETEAWNRMYFAALMFACVFIIWLLGAMNIGQFFFEGGYEWWLVAKSVYFLLPVTGMMLVYTTLNQRYKQNGRLVIIAFSLLFVVTLLSEILGQFAMEEGVLIYFGLIFTGGVYMVYALLRSSFEGNSYAKALSVPFVLAIVLAIFDGCNLMFNLLPYRGYVMPLSGYAFIIFVLGVVKEQLARENHLKIVAVGLRQAINAASERSAVDELTGCFNRVKMDSLLPKEIEWAKTTHSPLSMIMFDIDHFKDINDTYGHDVGDDVLQNFAALAKSAVDKDKTLVRWGGEEFILICPHLSLKDAAELAEKIRQMIAESEIGPRQVTVSGGVAIWHDGESQDKFFERLDVTLYQAKNSGRNQICTEKQTKKIKK